MLKKIEVFITLFILSTTIVFHSFVYATVPSEVDFPLLNDAIQTLYFMTGLGYKVENVNDEQGLYELMDEKTKQLWANEQAEKKQRLQDAWDEFIDSVKRGYGIAFHCDNELYEFLQDKAYTNAIAPSTLYKEMPQNMQNWLAGQTGNILILRNKWNSTYTPPYQIMIVNFGTYSILDTPVYEVSGTFNSQGYSSMRYRYTPVYNSNIRFTCCDLGDASWGGQLNTWVVDWLTNAPFYTCGNPDFAIINNHTSSYIFSTDALINDYISQGQYTDIIDNTYGVDTNGNVVIDSTGELPNVIGRVTTNEFIDSIKDGDTTWGNIIGSYAESEPAVPSIPADGALTLPQLDNLITDLHLERLNTKFPFCIPSDIKLIFDGATTVSGNAPVIHIPIHLEFRNHVFYDDSDGIVIDFNTFQPVVLVFREGFFLLFLLGLIWATIEVMQAFFIATE